MTEAHHVIGDFAGETKPLALTKFFTPDDFADPLLAEKVGQLKWHEQHLHRIGLPPPIPVEGRYWEYGIGLLVADIVKPKRVLEVGGGNSLYLPTLLQHHPDIEQVICVEQDGGSMGLQLAQCNHKPTGMAALPTGEFDLVACISVIEHIPDETFAMKLRDLVAPGGALYLTSDAALLQPDIYQFHWGRSRIYDPASWLKLANELMRTERQFGFMGRAEFTWRGTHVYDYSFASMALQRTR